MIYNAFRTMTKEDVHHIQKQSKRYKELQAIRKIALYTQDRARAYRCRVESEAIEVEILTKYDIKL